MDSKRIHEDITHLLYKVEEQYSRILNYDNSVPLMEVDLALKDVRDLYESLLDLRTLSEIERRKSQESNKNVPVNTDVLSDLTPIEVKVQEVPAPASEKIEKAPEQEIVVQTDVIPESTPLVVESKTEESPIAWQKTFDASQVNEETPSATVESPSPAIGSKKVDLLQERQKDFVPTVRKIEFKPEPAIVDPKKESLFDKAASLYDKIAKPTEKTVASQASQNPISNIKASIGINEKFVYLKELFKNNMIEYNDALDKLNNFENYGEAEDFFQELKAKYAWDPESKSFQGLAELLNRRYLLNA